MNETWIRPSATEIMEKADELARLSVHAAQTKNRIEVLKVWFETLATMDLKDSKRKTREYWGHGATRITVGNSDTVKPVSMTMVKKLLGPVFGDFVKEDVSYKMTEPCKRLFSMAFLGNYTEGDMERMLAAISQDEKIQKTLRKKLKGKYEKDTEALMKIAGLSEKEAGDWAYLAAEVLNWEWLLQILKAAEWDGSPQEAVELIRSAVIVDEGIKVTVDSKEE